MAKNKNENVEVTPQIKPMQYSFKAPEKVPNFSTTIKIGKEKKEVQCVNGKIETNDKILGEYLKKHDPFAVITSSTTGADPQILDELKDQLQLKSKLINEREAEIVELKKNISSGKEGSISAVVPESKKINELKEKVTKFQKESKDSVAENIKLKKEIVELEKKLDKKK